MKALGYKAILFLLRKALQGAAKLVRGRIDTPQEREALAEEIYTSQKSAIIKIIVKSLEKANTGLDKIDGEE